MLTCKDTSRLVSEAQERKLTLLEKINLRIHLLACDSCRRFEQQMMFIRKALKANLSDDPLPPTEEPMPEDSKKRILIAIQEQSNNNP